MRIKFWGVRGSIPTPSPDTVRFGGNTSCVSVDFGSDMVIFDAGTGIRLLGNEILSRPNSLGLHLFLSHSHWDHIQGFPFFGPAYRAGTRMDVYGQGHADQTLGHILAGQMEGPNFPVALNQLEATLAYRDIRPNAAIELGDPLPFAVVRATAGRHPNGVLVYRLDELRSGKSLVYATDTEHYPDRIDANLQTLAQGTDLLIYDGMYTPEEYAARHQGWGHSTWEKGFELAKAAGAKSYAVFHHDPSHSDDFLEAYERQIQLSVAGVDPAMSVFFAREGMEIELGEA